MIAGGGKEAILSGASRSEGTGARYLPGRISDLATGLSNVDGDDFAHNGGI